MHSSTVTCVMLMCAVSLVEVLSDGKTTGTVSTLYNIAYHRAQSTVG